MLREVTGDSNSGKPSHCALVMVNVIATIGTTLTTGPIPRRCLWTTFGSGTLYCSDGMLGGKPEDSTQELAEKLDDWTDFEYWCRMADDYWASWDFDEDEEEEQAQEDENEGEGGDGDEEEFE